MTNFKIVKLTDEQIEKCAETIYNKYSALNDDERKCFFPLTISDIIMSELKIMFPQQPMTISDSQIIQIYDEFNKLKKLNELIANEDLILTPEDSVIIDRIITED